MSSKSNLDAIYGIQANLPQEKEWRQERDTLRTEIIYDWFSAIMLKINKWLSIFFEPQTPLRIRQKLKTHSPNKMYKPFCVILEHPLTASQVKNLCSKRMLFKQQEESSELTCHCQDKCVGEMSVQREFYNVPPKF